MGRMGDTKPGTRGENQGRSNGAWRVNRRRHGAGAGRSRLGHRRSLDADAGELRACADAPGSRGGRTTRGRGPHVIRSRTRAARRAGHPVRLPPCASGRPVASLFIPIPHPAAFTIQGPPALHTCHSRQPQRTVGAGAGVAGSRGVQNETYSVGLRFAPPTYGLRTETPSSILMRDSAGIPKPLCRRQIIFSVSVRLRFNTS